MLMFRSIFIKVFLFAFISSLIITLFASNINDSFTLFSSCIFLLCAIVYLVENYDIKYFAVLLFTLSYIIKLIFIFNINTPVISDFLVQYNAAQKVASGELFTAFNSKYFSDAGFQAGFSLWQALILKIFIF